MDPNTPQKITKVSELISNMNRGSSSDEVIVLQKYLAANGHPEVKPDGVYGPVTEQAVKNFQIQNGLTADGVVGPQTRAKLSSIATTTETSGKSKDEIKAEYDAAAGKVFAGNDQTAIDYAIQTGDMSGLKDSTGKPFSDAIVAEDTKTATAMDKAYWDQAQNKSTADTTSTLAQDQLDYNKWLADQGNQFQADKTALDAEAGAWNGALFSGARLQKEKQLKDTYNSNQEYKLASLKNSMGNTARDYQSAYGNDAANSLSQYYNVGGNTYNPNVATGGVGKTGLSALYTPGNADYFGTENTKRNTSNLASTALLLKNRANKLMSTGLNNPIRA